MLDDESAYETTAAYHQAGGRLSFSWHLYQSSGVRLVSFAPLILELRREAHAKYLMCAVDRNLAERS
jgi:hypothetical protein